jgi:hypothetical protein
MENPSASECPTADRSDDVRGSFRNDIRVDDEREHQRLCEGTPGCKPVGAGKLFVRSLTIFASRPPTIG